MAGKSIYSRKETILKHVARLEAVAKGGKLPRRKWLVQNGYDQSQVYMREFPSYFAHLRIARQLHRKIDVGEAVRLLGENLSLAAIAKQLGCSSQGLQCALTDAGLRVPMLRLKKEPKQPKPPVLCAECGKQCPPHKHAGGARKYCSARCRRKASRRRYKESKARRHFCSDTCRQAAKKHKPAAAVNFTYQFSA